MIGFIDVAKVMLFVWRSSRLLAFLVLDLSGCWFLLFFLVCFEKIQQVDPLSRGSEGKCWGKPNDWIKNESVVKWTFKNVKINSPDLTERR